MNSGSGADRDAWGAAAAPPPALALTGGSRRGRGAGGGRGRWRQGGHRAGRGPGAPPSEAWLPVHGRAGGAAEVGQRGRAPRCHWSSVNAGDALRNPPPSTGRPAMSPGRPPARSGGAQGRQRALEELPGGLGSLSSSRVHTRSTRTSMNTRAWVYVHTCTHGPAHMHTYPHTHTHAHTCLTSPRGRTSRA